MFLSDVDVIMQQIIFRHSERTRNWMTVSLLCFGAGLTLFGLHGGADWYWFIGPGIFVFGAGWSVLINQKSGSVMSDETLRVLSGAWDQTIEISQLDRIVLHEWSDGPPDVTAVLKGGGNVTIPFSCIGRKDAFMDAMKRMAVKVEKS